MHCPSLRTDIDFYPGSISNSKTISVNPGDSFMVRVVGSNCFFTTVKSATIFFNGQTFQTFSSNFEIKLPCSFGTYKFSAENTYPRYNSWSINFIAKTKPVDISAIVSQTLTALPSVELLNLDFLFYPNPAHHEITLLNETGNIRSVTLYNSYGQLISTFNISGEVTKIPLKNCPAGIYYLHVATLTDKIMIRKISVL